MHIGEWCDVCILGLHAWLQANQVGLCRHIQCSSFQDCKQQILLPQNQKSLSPKSAKDSMLNTLLMAQRSWREAQCTRLQKMGLLGSVQPSPDKQVPLDDRDSDVRQSQPRMLLPMIWRCHCIWIRTRCKNLTLKGGATKGTRVKAGVERYGVNNKTCAY